MMLSQPSSARRFRTLLLAVSLRAHYKTETKAVQERRNFMPAVSRLRHPGCAIQFPTFYRNYRITCWRDREDATHGAGKPRRRYVISPMRQTRRISAKSNCPSMIQLVVLLCAGCATQPSTSREVSANLTQVMIDTVQSQFPTSEQSAVYVLCESFYRVKKAWPETSNEIRTFSDSYCAECVSVDWSKIKALTFDQTPTGDLAVSLELKAIKSRFTVRKPPLGVNVSRPSTGISEHARTFDGKRSESAAGGHGREDAAKPQQ